MARKMHDYPCGVFEAPQILDLIKPDWANAIDIDTLDMNVVDLCILGQVFGSYDEGIKFFRMTASEQESQWRDKIFGHHASISEWTAQINRRNGKVPYSTVTADSVKLTINGTTVNVLTAEIPNIIEQLKKFI